MNFKFLAVVIGLLFVTSVAHAEVISPKFLPLDSSSALGTSNVLIPTQGAVKSYVDTGLGGKIDVTALDTFGTLGGESASDAKVSSQKAVKSYVDTGLSGKQDSLGFTAEDVSNKSTNTSLGTSDTLYPSQGAVKSYVDTAIGNVPSQKVWLQEAITLDADDISAQYVDGSQNCVAASTMLRVSGAMGAPSADYSLSIEGGKTRISFVATTGWGTGSPQALVAGDVIRLVCQY
jgi:hypothetical protein